MTLKVFDADASPMDAKFVPDPPNRSSASSPFRVDEGYSEDPRNPTDSDTERDTDMEHGFDHSSPAQARISAARQWLLSQPVDVRTALAHDLMHSLPTSIIADLVQEANYRLHFDPVQCLPHETVTAIFEFLDPHSLLNAALTSKAWKLKAYSSRLWRGLFTQEGWTCDKDKLEILEATAKRQKKAPSPMHSVAMGEAAASQMLLSKRRRSLRQADTSRLQRTSPEVDEALDMRNIFLDAGMPDAAARYDREMPDALDSDASATTASAVSSHSRLLGWDPVFGETIVDWRYLYSQRRRLEKNWFAGKFHNFRLPHPDHQEEAHTQCVYTIQFSGSHLVSGSRDKTVRVWDLNSQRLRLPPLQGHTGSVLCLQFDERSSQDIIVSGGSDADVIIWRFSDGAMINRMALAHTESVLNLRFDERYLVTCSKDKTIRVWNRQHLLPTHEDYPDKSTARNATYPTHIVDIRDFASGIRSSLPAPLPPYSLLMTFDGHGAAVNALQVHGHEIVSASGDRKVMLWNIKTGDMTRVFSGHTKGIACIQYDGRRIVSGSSDNSVRIFDAVTSAEVATLEGHRNLVRTVQAEFGDMFTSAESLETEARQHDNLVYENRARRAAASSGHADDAMSVSDGGLETDGPGKRFVLGGKLPQGGGGTRWSKIVSGSYDETLIIWRRDKDGSWYMAKELHQEEALRNASRAAWQRRQLHPRRRVSQDATSAPAVPPAPQPDGLAQAASAATSAITVEQAARTRAWHLHMLVRERRARQRLAAGASATGAASTPTHEGEPESSNAAAASSTQTAMDISSGPEASPSPAPVDGSAALDLAEHPTFVPGALQPGDPVPDASDAPHHHHAPNADVSGSGDGAADAAANPLHHRPHHHHHHRHPHGIQTAAGGPSLNNRVFKLQFDTRRIVCCSQEPVIVGWDFGAGEPDVIEASWIFGMSS